VDLPPINEHATAAFRRFYTLIPRSEDSALIILKIHLLIEEQIRAFLDERLANAKSLKRADLTCHQAICLAEALSTEDIYPQVWEAARKLNELRNKIAHNLEPAGVLERMAEMCSLIGLTPDLRTGAPSVTRSPLDDFGFAASILYNEIALYVKRKPAEVLRIIGSDKDVP
jgi:hypothetical protein